MVKSYEKAYECPSSLTLAYDQPVDPEEGLNLVSEDERQPELIC